MKNQFLWQDCDPEDQGMSNTSLTEMCLRLAARHTRALLVIRNDRIVYEWYAPGHDLAKTHYTASLAKALVGGMSLLLAISDGLVDPDDPVCKFIPQWKNHPKNRRLPSVN